MSVSIEPEQARSAGQGISSEKGTEESEGAGWGTAVQIRGQQVQRS